MILLDFVEIQSFFEKKIKVQPENLMTFDENLRICWIKPNIWWNLVFTQNIWIKKKKLWIFSATDVNDVFSQIIFPSTLHSRQRARKWIICLPFSYTQIESHKITQSRMQNFIELKNFNYIIKRNIKKSFQSSYFWNSLWRQLNWVDKSARKIWMISITINNFCSLNH